MNAVDCPICAGEARPLDVVDFDVTCDEHQRMTQPLSGVPVYYFLCERCGHACAPEFRDWTPGDFARRIYNEEYAKIDPSYAGARGESNAALLRRLYEPAKGSIRHLDYGGGNGRLSEVLREAGWDSTCYDPFSPGNATPPAGTFNLITAFEVFEHVTWPKAMLEEIHGFLDDPGLVFFSTLENDGALAAGKRIQWWYCSPRAGHINLYSLKSLETLGWAFGLRTAHAAPGVHAYSNCMPAWATSPQLSYD